MSDIIIKVEGLGKSYIIGHEKREQYIALRDVITQKVRKVIAKTQQVIKQGQLIAGDEMEEFWALKDINFEVRQGDRIGIIGRNGAGKSTLLKLLSRITEPTKGKIMISGRIASLLEVGTGFHPELSGRENIFLNGAILGMSRAEIKKKFDEIVDFSDVEKFLDTPVKRYSSGMYVRLAFAIAAHMDPEILIVDEVLAVGDAEFQKKCLGKMEDVSSKEGRTVLFVSHNMGAINQLCKNAILLDAGQLLKQGNTAEIIGYYLFNERKNKGSYISQDKNKSNYLKRLVLYNINNIKTTSFRHDESIVFDVVLEINEWTKGLCLAIAIQDKLNRRVCLDYFSIEKDYIKENNSVKMKITLPDSFFTPGSYSIDLSIVIPSIQSFESHLSICPFEIVDNNSKLTLFPGVDAGCVIINSKYEIK